MKFYYVYILNSISNPEMRYFGFTENLDQRLKDHNSGKSTYTSKHKPWKIVTALAFTDRAKALKYENYLKSHAGRAYSAKHF